MNRCFGLVVTSLDRYASRGFSVPGLNTEITDRDAQIFSGDLPPNSRASL